MNGPAQPPPPVPPRILLVDDEPALRAFFARVLEEEGFTVVSAADAEAALERVYTAGAPFNLLVTDNTMPGLSGAALARQVRRVWPALPILCVTGRPPEPEEERAAACDAAPMRWLLKPVTAEELLAAVHALLRG